MRSLIAVLTGLMILAAANYRIFEKETLLAHGRTVILELAPVDPRSLMQGDFMALDFKVANAIERSGNAATESAEGCAVLKLDDDGVGAFARADGNAPLSNNEVRIRWKIRHGRVQLATNAFFFQEGDADLYDNAEYGEFRVNDDGDSILTGLRDKNLKPLGKKVGDE